MKTRALIVLLAVCMIAVSLVGCSSPSYKNHEEDYIKLGAYTNLTINLSEVNKEIQDRYHEAADADKSEKTYTSSNDGVLIQDGDTANIDYVGKIDGTEFSGGSGTKHDLVIGSGSFIDGFEDGLIGASVGQKLDVKATFPKDYQETTLAGKEAVFSVTVNSIKRTTYPEYNDANVEKYTDYKTVKEFEDSVIEEIKKDLAWEKFYESCKVIKYPKKELKKYYNDEIDSTTEYAASMGIDLATYASLFTGYSDLNQYFAYVANNAKSYVKRDLILAAMAKELGWKPLEGAALDAEFERLWNEYKTENDYTGSLKQFKKDYSKDAIRNNYTLDKIVELLVTNTTVNDDVTKNGIITDKTGTRYYIDNVMQTGWQSVDVDGDGNADKCYFNAKTGYLTVNGGYAKPEGADENAAEKFYKFTDKGVFVGIYNNEFYNDGAEIRYFVDGEYVKGWQTIDGNRYYFKPESGFAAVGDVMVEKSETDSTKMLGSFAEDGKFVRELMGWVDLGDGKVKYYYAKNDGTITFATGEKEIGGYTFYFGGKDGYMATPTTKEFGTDSEFGIIYGSAMYLFHKVEIEGATRYAVKTSHSGFYTTTDATYYFNSGKGCFGWVKDGDDMYYFSCKDGKMFTGVQTINGAERTFGEDGKLSGKLNGLVYDESTNLQYYIDNVAQSGLIEVDVDGDGTVDKCYFDKNNSNFGKKLGWLDVEGDQQYDYYIRDYKVVVNQETTIDNVKYKFEADGSWSILEG